jgi:hypothetical protein
LFLATFTALLTFAFNLEILVFALNPSIEQLPSLLQEAFVAGELLN